MISQSSWAVRWQYEVLRAHDGGIDNMMLLLMVDGSTHWYAGRAVQGGAIEDGGGADDQAEHDQPVDHKVLQGVPPAGG